MKFGTTPFHSDDFLIVLKAFLAMRAMPRAQPAWVWASNIVEHFAILRRSSLVFQVLEREAARHSLSLAWRHGWLS